jgi:hypothetical protein
MKIFKAVGYCALFLGAMNSAMATTSDRYEHEKKSHTDQFSIALIGDFPYSQGQEPEFVN